MRSQIYNSNSTNLLKTLIITNVILLILNLTVFASSEINGIIKDKSTDLPVSGVTINLAPGDFNTTSDQNGQFNFKGLERGQFNLIITHIGYKSQTELIAIENIDADVNIEIKLNVRSIPLPGMIVTPSRISQSQFRTVQNISTTEAESFSEKQFSTTAELIRDEPGILVQKTTHGHGSPIIRGLIGKYVLILFDGIRLNKPTFRFGANQYLNTVNPKMLKSLEVVRGPSSIVYGSDAIGGAINLIPLSLSNGMSKSKIDYNLLGEYSSIDEGKGYHLQVFGNFPNLVLMYGIGYKDIGHLKRGGDNKIQIPTGWKENAHSAQLVWKPTNWLILKYSLQIVRQENVPRYDKYVSGDFDQYIYDPQNRTLDVLKLTAIKSSKFWDVVDLAISYQLDSEGRTTQKYGSSTINYSEDCLTTWGGYLQFSRQFSSDHILIYGADYYRHRIKSSSINMENNTVESTRPTYPDNSYYRSAGLFIQDEYSLTSCLNFNLGIRYSQETINSMLEEPFGKYTPLFNDLSGSVAINYLLNNSINLIGRWSRGFRAPNFNDALVLKYSSSGVDVPSINLEPEKSNSFELGIKLSSGFIRGSLFMFYNRLSNLLGRQPGIYNNLDFFDEDNDGIHDSNEFDVYQKFNIDLANIYGCEYESNIKINQSVNISSNLTWTYGKNLSQNEPLSRIPPLMGALAAKTDISKNTWWQLKIRFAAAQRRLSVGDIDDTRIEPGGTPGWITLNSGMHFQIKNLAVTVMLHNIFDQKYKEHGSGIYSPGRGITLTMNYSSL